MKTITVTQKHGIDDLLGLYAYRGNSQGDDSGSNIVHSDKESGGWMSYVFEGVEETQEAIYAEVERRKAWNENYIKELKEKGEYGKEYEVSVSFKEHPMFDSQPPEAPLSSYSFHIIDLSK